ncbi:uncharacterized protein LOC115882789 [Sitophilus oryzae]|uniref:Gustatory receptor n=1 Tax=Sitophilus oryzae TaxID=7048 RepID=A0A6J2XZF3_SITOR|nr:uncharacterized protein LOC115882789 [Sitophilus oryzae]
MVFVFITLNDFLGNHQRDKIVSFVVNNAIIVVDMLLIYSAVISTLRRSTWKKFIKKMDLLHKYYQFQDDNLIKTLADVIGFFVIHGILLYITYLFYEFQERAVSTFSAVVLAFPTVQLTYQYLQMTTILVIIQEIKRNLEKVSKHVEFKGMNLKKAKMCYLNTQENVNCFNKIFGYQIFLSFAYWILAFESICLYLFENYKHRYKTTIDFELIFFFVVFMSLISASLLAVVFSCDGISAECRKLIDYISDVQEMLHRKSLEYMELESLIFYIQNNQLSFTAAGFFEIKSSSVLALIATSTTHFIALSQFY